MQITFYGPQLISRVGATKGDEAHVPQRVCVYFPTVSVRNIHKIIHTLAKITGLQCLEPPHMNDATTLLLELCAMFINHT